ncbi:MAG: type II secretion system secretin GspD [Desulfobacterales bacterium]|nr:type II secretion system secretin GspD [Desulfobacterales bacterium]
MKTRGYLSTTIFGMLIISVLLTFTTPSFAERKETGPANDVSPTDRSVNIDFNNVDISVFIKFISELTGRNFVIDQRVKGKVTIISPARISVREAYRVFQSVLEVHGFAAVEAGEVIKIIPSPDARTKNIETRFNSDMISPEDRVVTQLIPLTYADPTQIKHLFTPLVSKNSVILDYPPTNMLIVTDIYSNIQRLMKIVDEIDITGIGNKLSVIHLEYAGAKNMVDILSRVFAVSPHQKTDVNENIVKFVADERTNTVVILASEENTQKIKTLVIELDREAPRGKGKIQVYYLQNADAEALAKVLQELPTKGATQDKTASNMALISSKARITADKATNSLIIMSGNEDYQVIKEIIEKLDVPRAMVYIESLIMEVDVNKDFRLGVEWAAGNDFTYDNGKQGIYGGGFAGGAAGGDPGFASVSPSGAPIPLPPGFSLGVFGEALQIGDLIFPNLAAIVQAYQKDDDVHILSTPQLLTTDNAEATITVGKNIPYQTRSTASTTGTEIYSSFEYKDVGVTLKITPHISKDRLVRLKISQEITKLTGQSSLTPTTFKRSIDTTVIVKDSDTVVIGGLIDDTMSGTEYKVPCLGDIPYLGNFFRSSGTTRNKTNLYLFITPRVLGTPAEAKEIYSEKKNKFIDIENNPELKKYYNTSLPEPKDMNKDVSEPDITVPEVIEMKESITVENEIIGSEVFTIEQPETGEPDFEDAEKME